MDFGQIIFCRFLNFTIKRTVTCLNSEILLKMVITSPIPTYSIYTLSLSHDYQLFNPISWRGVGVCNLHFRKGVTGTGSDKFVVGIMSWGLPENLFTAWPLKTNVFIVLVMFQTNFVSECCCYCKIKGQKLKSAPIPF